MFRELGEGCDPYVVDSRMPRIFSYILVLLSSQPLSEPAPFGLLVYSDIHLIFLSIDSWNLVAVAASFAIPEKSFWRSLLEPSPSTMLLPKAY